MVMKMHSYMVVNGQLQYIENEAKSLLSQLKFATESAGGWDKAIRVASAKQAEQQAKMAAASEADKSNVEMESIPVGTPHMPEGLSTSYVDATTANALRKRLVAISDARSSGTSISTSSVDNYLSPPGPGNFSHFNRISSEINSPQTEDEVQSKDIPERPTNVVQEDEDHIEALEQHVLVHHPDERISALAHEYSDVQSELISAGQNHVRWPDTITWKNFALYQLIPTLVYELEYPRTERFVLTFAIFGIFT
jgi:sterol O-acyltransferase